jgi:hypothetical protein
MRRRGDGLNTEIGGVVSQVLGELSLEQAAIHLNYRVSRTPIGDLKRGKVGREGTLREFAEGFWPRFCEEFGEEVIERFGECSQRSVSDWLAEKAGFEPRYYSRAPARELTYHPELADVDIRGFKGAQGLSDADIDLVNTAMRALIAQLRQQRGLG